jgi:hypothetical protein
MITRVVDVKPLEDYQLALSFDTGESGIFDCKPYLNTGIFQELKNKGYFSTVKVWAGTVRWPNDQDFCPDTLYSELQKIH